MHRCQRIIVHYDHICRRAFSENAEFFLKVAVCNLRISFKKHLRNFAPCSIRITEMMLVKNICHLPGFHHIMGIAVCSKSGKDSLMYQFHGRRTSAGISHIGFRIVYDHGICLFDQIHLMFIDINTVSKQSLRTKDIPVIQSVYDSFAVFLKALMKIIDSLCHMDMIADPFRLQFPAQCHCLI